MTTGLFTFEDALHNHLSIGNVEACPACAQTRCDMALSAAAYHAAREAQVRTPMLTRVPVIVSGRRSGSGVSRNRKSAKRTHRTAVTSAA